MCERDNPSATDDVISELSPREDVNKQQNREQTEKPEINDTKIRCEKLPEMTFGVLYTFTHTHTHTILT